MESDWWLPWNRDVTASDASPEGFGIVSSRWSSHDVASVGRVRKRYRFRRGGTVAPRESAMSAAGFALEDGRWRPRAGDELDED
eukprot:8344428-Pyramimonas_sp.AAC.1